MLAVVLRVSWTLLIHVEGRELSVNSVRDLSKLLEIDELHVYPSRLIVTLLSSSCTSFE